MAATVAAIAIAITTETETKIEMTSETKIETRSVPASATAAATVSRIGKDAVMTGTETAIEIGEAEVEAGIDTGPLGRTLRRPRRARGRIG